MSIRLEDIELIKQLKHRYFRGIDTADMAVLKDLFTDDVKIDYQGGSYHIQLQGKDTLLKYLADSFNPQAVGMHNGHHPEITVHSETSAEGIWYLHDIFMNLKTKELTQGSALYRDTYEKVGGQWKIKVSTYKRVFEAVRVLDDVEKEFGKLAYHHLAHIGKKAAE